MGAAEVDHASAGAVDGGASRRRFGDGRLRGREGAIVHVGRVGNGWVSAFRRCPVTGGSNSSGGAALGSLDSSAPAMGLLVVMISESSFRRRTSQIDPRTAMTATAAKQMRVSRRLRARRLACASATASRRRRFSRWRCRFGVLIDSLLGEEPDGERRHHHHSHNHRDDGYQRAALAVSTRSATARLVGRELLGAQAAFSDSALRRHNAYRTAGSPMRHRHFWANPARRSDLKLSARCLFYEPADACVLPPLRVSWRRDDGIIEECRVDKAATLLRLLAFLELPRAWSASWRSSRRVLPLETEQTSRSERRHLPRAASRWSRLRRRSAQRARWRSATPSIASP